MNMSVLVIGGTGMIGSHIATRLRDRGDTVTIASRSTEGPYDPPAIAGILRAQIDYTDPALTAEVLRGYDAIVFSAGNDIRHVDAADESPEFWERVQSKGVPRFAEIAREAGVKRFVQIGSYYHQLHPEWAENDAYVNARKLADERTRALATEGFAPITINPPSIVGVIPGRVLKRFTGMISWVRGELDEPEFFGPAGGTNYMSIRSLAEAVEGALDRGEGGKAYLVGDENLRYHEFWQKIANAAGADVTIEERDEEHPFQPDRFIVQGRGNVITYETDADETALLGYTKHDIDRALAEIVALSDAKMRKQ